MGNFIYFVPSRLQANGLLAEYSPGLLENSAKFEVFFSLLEETVAAGDRMLLFSQSLFTLNLLEEFLQERNVPGTQCQKNELSFRYVNLFFFSVFPT